MRFTCSGVSCADIIAHTFIHFAGLVVLATAIEYSSALTKLDLADNSLGPEGARFIINAIAKVIVYPEG